MEYLQSKDYYNENYIDYELQTSPAKIRFYRHLLNRWVAEGSSVFEIGVGMGHFLQLISEQYVCSGCDINEYGLTQARQKVPQACLKLGSYETIPTDPPLDAVVAWDVLEHFSDLHQGLSEIYSRLANGGFLLGVVPVYDGPLGGLVRFLDRDPTHISKYSRWEWLRHLRQHHFELVQTGGVFRKLLFSKWYIHITQPQGLLWRMGSAIFFVVRKRIV